MHTSLKDYWTLQEIAEREGVDRRTVWHWVRKGWLKATKVSSHYYLVTPADYAAFERPRRGPRPRNGVAI